MGINEIKIKILDDARLEAERIEQKARGEVRTIEESAHLEAEKVRTGILAEAKKKAEEVRRSVITPARLSAKKRILEEKHRLLNEVFKGAPEEVREEKIIEVAQWLNSHTQ